MRLPDTLRESVRRTLERYCEKKRVPPHVRDEVRLVVEIEGPRATIYEERAPWNGRGDWTRGGVARFRYLAKERLWTLYWRDRNGRWHFYEHARPAPTIDRLLAEVDRDPTGIFWG
ncbi:MAG: DUF3024 domain-containing protein [Thermoanaerobaculia bacterium]